VASVIENEAAGRKKTKSHHKIIKISRLMVHYEDDDDDDDVCK
jgi:hypothetical protein